MRECLWSLGQEGRGVSSWGRKRKLIGNYSFHQRCSGALSGYFPSLSDNCIDAQRNEKMALYVHLLMIFMLSTCQLLIGAPKMAQGQDLKHSLETIN